MEKDDKCLNFTLIILFGVAHISCGSMTGFLNVMTQNAAIHDFYNKGPGHSEHKF